MYYFWLIFFICVQLCAINSEKLGGETEGNLSMLRSSGENKTNAIRTSGNIALSSHLPEIHDLAKDISHSKGIYRQPNGDLTSVDEPELRRSILKKVAVASESDGLKAILEKFYSYDNKLQLLEQMEYLVHQYDVAVNFAASGGIEVIMPFLFSSEDDIASSVASVLGSAMQSNPTVQKYAVKHHVGKNLFKLLSHKSPVVLPRIIFALGSFLRNVPEAQMEFLAVNGASELVDILKSHQVTTSTKLKIINLFNDMAVEQQTAELYPNESSFKKITEYKRMFTYKIQSSDLCKVISSFLNLEDFDAHQKVVAAMISLYNVCNKDFMDRTINNRLSKLRKIYDPESDDNDPLYPNIDKDLKEGLHSEIITLIKKLYKEEVNEFKSKIEL